MFWGWVGVGAWSTRGLGAQGFRICRLRYPPYSLLADIPIKDALERDSSISRYLLQGAGWGGGRAGGGGGGGSGEFTGQEVLDIDFAGLCNVMAMAMEFPA